MEQHLVASTQITQKDHEQTEMKHLKLHKGQIVTSSGSKTEKCQKNRNFLKQGEVLHDKIFKRKPQSILAKLIATHPAYFGHITNFFNILSINEKALTDTAHEESFYRSMFYINTIERVEVRKNALIIHLNNTNDILKQSERLKIQDLIDRLQTNNNPQCQTLAHELTQTYQKYNQVDYKNKITRCYDNQPLSRFIERMQDKIYICKIAPNKMVLSRALLELLGEDLEAYAIELTKYKTPLREFLSNFNYAPLMTKSVQNLGLLCDFLDNRIDLNTFLENPVFEFSDYLYTRKHRKIACKLQLSTPNPLMTCLEAVEVGAETQRSSLCETTSENCYKNKLIELEIRDLKYRESESLRHITQLQTNMLIENRRRVATYIERPTVTTVSA